MNLKHLFSQKDIKNKAKSEIIRAWLFDKNISTDDLLKFAESEKDVIKATCIEALEFLSKNNPEIIDYKCFEFMIKNVLSSAPRVKLESARVIGNTAHLFSDKLSKAINNLILNTTHEGIVVRWSSAFALGEIIKLKTKHNKNLLAKVEVIMNNENENSIKKIYNNAITKAGK